MYSRGTVFGWKNARCAVCSLRQLGIRELIPHAHVFKASCYFDTNKSDVLACSVFVQVFSFYRAEMN